MNTIMGENFVVNVDDFGSANPAKKYVWGLPLEPPPKSVSASRYIIDHEGTMLECEGTSSEAPDDGESNLLPMETDPDPSQMGMKN